MVCPHKVLVVRSNYGDESIALIAALRKDFKQNSFEKIFVVSIDTGWAAQSWPERVKLGQAFAQSCGFTPIHLTSRRTFSELVIERQNFPTTKYQWCAGFLKGLPLLEWLDEHDPACEWLIALPKRQALYRNQIAEFKAECEYHGERDIWHPIHSMTHLERDQLILQSGFTVLNTRSLECEPCVNSTLAERHAMDPIDKSKLQRLEQQIGKTLFVNSQQSTTKSTRMDLFSMGCGDPFGCGM